MAAGQIEVRIEIRRDWPLLDNSSSMAPALGPAGSAAGLGSNLRRLDRWRALNEAERDGFPPLCPDLVVELAGAAGLVPDPGSPWSSITPASENPPA